MRGVKNIEKSADVLYGSTQGVRQILKLVLICLLGRSKVVISSVEKKPSTFRLDNLIC